MISDEELHEIAREDEGSDVQFQTSIMAREILAYRKAFIEPVAYEWETNAGFGVSKEIPKIPEDCYISIKALYRKNHPLVGDLK